MNEKISQYYILRDKLLEEGVDFWWAKQYIVEWLKEHYPAETFESDVLVDMIEFCSFMIDKQNF